MVSIHDFVEIDPLCVFGSIRKYFSYNLSQVATGGHIVECGVYKGTTINHIAELVNPRPVYGFDSFEGLPEPWELGEDTMVKTGHFATRELPKVKKNVELVQGLFKDTLPSWIGASPDPVAFLHLDCDIYSSTIDALTILNHALVVGSVVIFDDMYAWQDEDDYPYWRRGQWKAMREWMRDYSREFEVISRMRRRQSCAIRITK